MNNKNISLFINVFIFVFIVSSIIIYPEETFKASVEGLNLWFNSVCPALLPFFICTEILIGLGVVTFIGSMFKPLMNVLFNIPGEGAFAFVMSVTSGYPVGAKIIANLRNNKQCTKVEAQRMISLCSTSGPLFIIGVVSVGMLKKAEIAPLLLISHYLSAISCGFIMKFYRKNEKPSSVNIIMNPIKEMLKHRERDKRRIGELIGDSVKNGINLILFIGGYIILFSVISRIIKITGLLGLLIKVINLLPFIHIENSDFISVIITGVLEVTNGIKECTFLDLQEIIKVIVISFFIGFGGLSINAQVSGIIQETDIKFSLYFIMKIIQGFFAAIYTFLLSKISVFPVFNPYYPLYPSYSSLSWYSTFALSTKLLAEYLLILVLLSILVHLVFHLKSRGVKNS